jgi:hypothetical protein
VLWTERLPGGAAPGGDEGAANADGSTTPRTTAHRSSPRALRLDEEKSAWWMRFEGTRVKRSWVGGRVGFI